MSEKGTQKRIAIVGFVNTEEIIARKLRKVILDGFLIFPNAAFADCCDNSVILDDDFLENQIMERLSGKYQILYLGPVLATILLAQRLHEAGIPFIGATMEQLKYELDKSLIHEVFAKTPEVLPLSVVLTDHSPQVISEVLESFDGNYVLKFVGDYTQKYSGSEVGRVRFSQETLADETEAMKFIQDSIEVSGKVIVQEKLVGQEFSANYMVDANGNFFRLGENICYKRRENNNTGPICDGTGSLSINNSLPFLTKEDIDFVEQKILIPFLDHVKEKTGRPLCTMLNLDLMKTQDGRIVLFEVNCREPGGHTMANVLSGLENDLFEVFSHTINGTLDKITPKFKTGVSIVVSSFPSYFPFGVESVKDMMVMKVTKDIPVDVKLYTGWVELLSENDSARELRLNNSPVLLFEHFNSNVALARERIYEVINNVVNGMLDYRTDIGIDYEGYTL